MANTLTVASEKHLELDVKRPGGTVRYRPDAHGRVTPRSKADELVLREGGASIANTAIAISGRGRRCEDCGFVGFFTTCGRCNGPCIPEEGN